MLILICVIYIYIHKAAGLCDRYDWLDGGPASGVNTGPYDWTHGLVIDHRTNRQLPRRMFDVCIADAWWNLGGCGDGL